MVASSCLNTRKLLALESGMYADAGHAQPGPSTGGYTVELGTTTIHAVSGQHHATTLGTSDSESYEVSRAAAAALAFRSFMTEFGFPQKRSTEIKNDNSGTVAKAASDASDKRSLYMQRPVVSSSSRRRRGLERSWLCTFSRRAIVRIFSRSPSPRRSTTLSATRSSMCGERRLIFTASWHDTCLSREAHIPGTSADEGSGHVPKNRYA